MRTSLIFNIALYSMQAYWPLHSCVSVIINLVFVVHGDLHIIAWRDEQHSLKQHSLRAIKCLRSFLAIQFVRRAEVHASTPSAKAPPLQSKQEPLYTPFLSWWSYKAGLVPARYSGRPPRFVAGVTARRVGVAPVFIGCSDARHCSDCTTATTEVCGYARPIRLQAPISCMCLANPRSSAKT